MVAAGSTLPAAPLAVNADRLRADLEGLSLFGRPPGGSFSDGVSRVAYSAADVEGRQFVAGRMVAPTVAIGDLEGDGDLEVVAAEDLFIHVWHHDGTRLPGWTRPGKMRP